MNLRGLQWGNYKRSEEVSGGCVEVAQGQNGYLRGCLRAATGSHHVLLVAIVGCGGGGVAGGAGCSWRARPWLLK